MVTTNIAIAALGAGIAVGASGLASGIGAGITGAVGSGVIVENPKKFGLAIIFQAIPQTQGFYGFLVGILILFGSGILGGNVTDIPLSSALACLGAGLAIGIAGFSAIGQGIASGAGLNASTRETGMFGKAMVFSVLPETQAIYGLLVAVLILAGGGLLGGDMNLTVAAGIGAVGAGLATGISGMSAIGQGIAAGSGVSATAEDKNMFARGMIFSVLPETQAIYGLLIAILILFFTGVTGATLNGAIGIPASIAMIGAGLAVGIAGLSGIGQGIGAGAGISAIAREKAVFGKAMVFGVLPETQAIYGLLVAVLILAGAGLLGGTPTLSLAAGVGAIGAGLAIGLAGLSGIGQGIAAASAVAATGEDPKMFAKGMIFSVLPETQAIYGLLVAILILFFTGVTGATAVGALELPVGLAAVGAGLAIGIAGLSAIGQGIGAAAGVGATAKDGTIFGKAMVFSVLPETQAIYGLLVAVLLLAGSGLLGGGGSLTLPAGVAAIGAGLAIGFAGLSGIGQGIAAASGVSATGEDKKMFAKGMIFSVLPETQAIYGLLIAILIMFFTGLTGASAVGLLDFPVGIAAIGAGLAIGIAGLSAIGQGIGAAGGITSTAREKSVFGKAMVFGVLPETQAIYGLLVAVLILAGAGLLGGTPTLSLAAGVGAIGAGLAIGLAGLSGIGQGIAAASAVAATGEDPKMFAKGMIFSVLPETQAIYGLLVAILILFFTGVTGATAVGALELPVGLAAVGAGLAIGIAGLSAIGQGIGASAGVGATAKDSTIFGKAMVFAVLPETQAIYGLLVAVLILAGSGLLSGTTSIGIPTGLATIGAGLAVGIAGLSAIGQGISAAGGVSATAEDKKMFGRGMIFSVLPETQAIYGLLVAILIMYFSGVIGAAGIGMVTMSTGIAAIAAGLSIGLAGLSAIGQGIAAGAATVGTLKRSDAMGKGLILAVMPETFAILGLLIAILIMINSGLIGA